MFRAGGLALQQVLRRASSEQGYDTRLLRRSRGTPCEGQGRDGLLLGLDDVGILKDTLLLEGLRGELLTLGTLGIEGNMDAFDQVVGPHLKGLVELRGC